MNNNLQHKTIEQSWAKLNTIEKLANIGSEVERAINWRKKNNEKFSQKAFLRSLELFDLTIQNLKESSQLKEITRAKELFCDFFIGNNQYGSTSESWQKYFYYFNLLARRKLP